MPLYQAIYEARYFQQRQRICRQQLSRGFYDTSTNLSETLTFMNAMSLGEIQPRYFLDMQ